MTAFQIVGLYAALYILLGVFLTVRVIQIRFGNVISIGDGGNETLAKRMRAHGNFIESAPFMLIALIVSANLNAAPIALHAFGAVFLIGRILHSIGMVGKPANLPRQIGMVLSLLSLIGVALYILYLILLHGPV